MTSTSNTRAIEGERMMEEQTKLIVDKLRRVLQTMSNDDGSMPGSAERVRHAERSAAILEAVEFLSGLASRPEQREESVDLRLAAEQVVQTWSYHSGTDRQGYVRIRSSDCLNLAQALSTVPKPATQHEAATSGDLSLDEVERLLRDYGAQWGGIAGYALGAEKRADLIKEKIFTAIRSLVSQAREQGIEEAALWHVEQIQGGHCGEASDEMMVRQRIERHHRRSAEAIRALKNATPARSDAGKEGDAA